MIKDVRFLPKITFLAVVFDAEFESNFEELSAFFMGEAKQRQWRLKSGKQQINYRLLVFCEGRLARSIELTTRGRRVQFYGVIF